LSDAREIAWCGYGSALESPQDNQESAERVPVRVISDENMQHGQLWKGQDVRG